MDFEVNIEKETYSFAIGQKIVYPSQGVGTINSIVEKRFKDELVPYYVIYLDATDMTVMVPVISAAELGIRAIVAPEDAEEALKLVGEDFEPITSDWKLRYQINHDHLKKGSIHDIATIVRSLYHRSKVKELPVMERKLYDSALKLLEEEIAYALKKPREEIKGLILTQLSAKTTNG
ncbi:putative CarD family transcriptional regulator, regulator of rRNA transcription [Pillotina sp. SPG140]|jgi:CarD family transcriptional regulator